MKSKRIISIVFLCLAIASAACAAVISHVQIGSLYYNLDDVAMTAEVTWDKNGMGNYSGLTDVVIPSTVDYNGQTYTVTAIGTGAFIMCFGLQSLEIPETVTVIENMAFMSCASLTSITFASETPPTFNGNIAVTLPSTSINIYVPPGSEDAYGTALGSFLPSDKIQPAHGPDRTITVLSEDEAKGTVSGGGVYEEGAQVQITATPETCFRFVRWTDGDTSNPRTITVGAEDASYIAQFDVIQLNVEVTADDPAHGSVSIQ